MNSDVVSIIVPIYNVSLYLERCILSIINQTYQSLDIILIDDGSTDNSGQICDNFATRDSRIKVWHQSNKGLSKTRNFGIERAFGKFLVFVDGDDYLTENHIENAIKQMYDNDILCTGYTKVDSNGNLLNVRKLKCDINSKHILHSVWSKLYKTEFIKTNQLSFYQINPGEDILFLFRCLAVTNKFAISDLTGYYYVTNPNSISHTIYNNIDQQIEIIFSQINHIITDYPLNFQKEKEQISFSLIKIALFFIRHLSFSCNSKADYKHKSRQILSTAFEIIQLHHLGKPNYFLAEKFSTNIVVLFCWLLFKIGLYTPLVPYIFRYRK